MRVYGLYVFRTAFIPLEDDPPLLADPDAMYPSKVTAQLLKPITWWRDLRSSTVGAVRARYTPQIAHTA